jgi:hypothetical protein
MKEKTVVVRMTESSQRLLLAMNKKSIDGGVKFLWTKLCKQGKEIKQLRQKVQEYESRYRESSTNS